MIIRGAGKKAGNGKWGVENPYTYTTVSWEIIIVKEINNGLGRSIEKCSGPTSEKLKNRGLIPGVPNFKVYQPPAYSVSCLG